MMPKMDGWQVCREIRVNSQNYSSPGNPGPAYASCSHHLLPVFSVCPYIPSPFCCKQELTQREQTVREKERELHIENTGNTGNTETEVSQKIPLVIQDIGLVGIQCDHKHGNDCHNHHDVHDH